MGKSYLESLLGERETILLTFRQHWFLLLSSILVEVFSIFFLLIITVALSIYSQSMAAVKDYVWIIVVLGFILMLIPVFTMTRDILNWSHRQFLVTNLRVIQISGIINKKVTDSSLEKVNDIKMDQSFFGRIFNYGDIEILTASELGANLFKRIESPVRFKTALLNAKETLEHHFEEPGKMEDIPALIGRLDQLRVQGIISEEEFITKKTQLLARL